MIKKYKKHLGWFLYSSLATFCLGIFLLIPILNNYLLNEVIRQETNINTKYYYKSIFVKAVNSEQEEGE